MSLSSASLSGSTNHIMLIAGETSGDAHAAAVVQALKALKQDCHFTGLGGPEMRQAGVDTFFDSSRIAVMGIVEVLTHWRVIKQALALVKQRLEQDRPDLIILVDYPEFNLKIAAHARTLGIKVLYYISPKIWASRPERIHKIGQVVDHMAVIFKFETEIYEQAGIPVTFVGNPLVDKVKTTENQSSVRQSLQQQAGDRIIGLFPGSRRSEISRLIPVMLDTAETLLHHDPALSFVVPVAANLDFDSIKRQCDQRQLPLTVTQQHLYDVTKSCDAIVSCSGTMTLEIGLLEVPLCVVYKLSWLSYQILSRIVTIDHISLVNIIARQGLVKELLQDRANRELISEEILALLNDQPYRDRIIKGLKEVKHDLGPGQGSQRMAQLVLQLLAK